MKRSFVPRLLVLHLACLVASGCSQGARIVARVGQTEITDRDVRLRTEEQSFENQIARKDPAAALEQLLKARLSAEILRKYGRPITAATLETEAARMQKESLMPDRLRAIERSFDTRDDFLNLYVLPAYMNHLIYYDFWIKTPQFHQEAFLKLEKFRAALQAANAPGVPFERLARAQGLSPARFRVDSAGITAIGPGQAREAARPPGASRSEAPPAVRAAVEGQANGTRDARSLVAQVLSKYQPGQVTEVVEWPTHLSVMRILERREDEFVVEAASAPKTGFEEWFKREARGIAWECTDAVACAACTVCKELH